MAWWILRLSDVCSWYLHLILSWERDWLYLDGISSDYLPLLSLVFSISITQQVLYDSSICNLFCFFRLIRQFYYHSISAVFQWIPDYSLQLVNLCYLSPCLNNLALPIGMFCRFIDYVPVPAMSRFSQYQSFRSKIYSFSLKYIK